MADDDAEGKLITITIKTSNAMATLEVDQDTQIKNIKSLVAEQFSTDMERLVFVFAGKIMNDMDTLRMHTVKSGRTVHLIIKSSTSIATPPSVSATDTADVVASLTPYDEALLGGNWNERETLGHDAATFMQLQRSIMNVLLRNTDLLKTLVSSPELQEMANNPEALHALITAYPQIQQLMQANPEITNLINNPNVLRQTMEMAQNPAVQEELLRQQNPDPVLPAMDDLNGFHAWCPTGSTDDPAVVNAPPQGILSNNPFAGLIDMTSESPQTGTVSQLPIRGGGGVSPVDASAFEAISPVGGTSFLQAPAMQNLLTQLTENPGLMQNILNAPYARSLVESHAAHANANVASIVMPTAEERYRAQVDELAAMGFTNRESNLEALIFTHGDVPSAVERLLNIFDLAAP